MSCYNGSRIFRLDLIFIKLDETIVKVEVNNEVEVIADERKRVVRDFYKVIRAEGLIDDMKKQFIMIGIVVILVTVGLNGCIDSVSNTSKVNREKILGRWIGTIPNTSIIVIMNFFTNESYYESLNETETVLWGKYKIIDEALVLQSVGATKATTYEYVFSNGNNTLRLGETGVEGVNLVLTRQ